MPIQQIFYISKQNFSAWVSLAVTWTIYQWEKATSKIIKKKSKSKGKNQKPLPDKQEHGEKWNSTSVNDVFFVTKSAKLVNNVFFLPNRNKNTTGRKKETNILECHNW